MQKKGYKAHKKVIFCELFLGVFLLNNKESTHCKGIPRNLTILWNFSCLFSCHKKGKGKLYFVIEHVGDLFGSISRVFFSV